MNDGRATCAARPSCQCFSAFSTLTIFALSSSAYGALKPASRDATETCRPSVEGFAHLVEVFVLIVNSREPTLAMPDHEFRHFVRRDG